MLEKLKNNIGNITCLLSVVSAALLVPTILSSIGNELTESVIVTIIQYLLTLTACILLLIPKQNLRRILPISHVLFYGALAFVQGYNAILGNLSSYAMTLLYGAVAVLVWILPCRKAFRLTTVIAIAFFLASALGGGAVNLSRLCFSLILAVNEYFTMEKETSL